MKRKIILSICTLALVLSLSLSSAMAKGGGHRPPAPSATPATQSYDYVDLWIAGQICLETRRGSREYALSVDSVELFVDGEEQNMTRLRRSGDKDYPWAFQSGRGLSIPEGATIRVVCAFTYRLGRDSQTGTGSFVFIAGDEYSGPEQSGLELRITAALVEQAIQSPSPTPLSPSPSISPSPTPSADPSVSPPASPTPTADPSASPSASPTPTADPSASPSASPTASVEPSASPSASPTPTASASVSPSASPTPKPTVKPTPTPRNILPQTGETADMWLVMLVLTGLCAVTGAVLLILRRAHRD